ncbi:MAG: Eco57I restriction-modification methylase domain-containing protein, partial [Fibromonadales bacterium]|nr:Eco57I restriction-modification methylase domain-containing protein [Fibromonadales bacterium]
MKTIEQSLDSAFLKQKPENKEIELFKKEFAILQNRISVKESEEFHKNIITEFLNAVYYKNSYYINTKGKTDLVIHNGNNTTSSVGVLIEAKNPVNRAEMPSRENLDVKSFQELVLYYLRERKTGKNFELRYLIITNIYEWFVFDARNFENTFGSDTKLEKAFTEFENKKSAITSTDKFYKEVASPAIKKHLEKLEYTYFDIRDYNSKDDRKLIALCKFFHPVHLLKLHLASDSNQLNRDFYAELLHIIGLEEVARDGRKLIIRKEADNTGSIIESAIHQIQSDDSKALSDSQYGKSREERAFDVAFRLSIIWINRILFLKLLEAQILKYHNGNKDYAFLSTDKLKSYGDLNDLFFSILAVETNKRSGNLKIKFDKVPYLNSSLFEQTDIEGNSIYIRALGNITDYVQYPKSILLREKPFALPASHLEYLLRFLDSYDFSNERSDDVLRENKPLISASVLGLIFEKINGYRDGSFFTPSFITMYMCREAIGSAVIQKFNETKNWNCQDIKDVHNKIEDIEEANEIVDSIRICDPAVGSGHFLVSALNEMVYLKYELGILVDKNGKKLRDYNVHIENDELIITDSDENYFSYNPKNMESQRVQETLFEQKRKIIENCLFGVDVNPNSVEICRLRLWIELLKNAYYCDNGKGELKTLPNIDINIKCGNSLISRFDLFENAKLDHPTQLKLQELTKSYKYQVFLYKNCTDDRETKKVIRKKIEEIKRSFSEINDTKDIDFSKWCEAKNKYNAHAYSMRFGDDKGEWERVLDDLKQTEENLGKIYQEKITNAYSNALEWSFEFPEAMDEDGKFVGFDVVIGNPPYIQLQSMGNIVNVYKNMAYEVFERKGDIYCLFYERSYQLLRGRGRLCFVTSNKWMRADYGKKLRNFFVKNTNSELLIDFAGTKVFDEATVDVNILMFVKDKNRQKTQACIVKKEGIKKMNDFIKHNGID